MSDERDEPKWRGSNAKAYLEGLIRSNKVPSDMKPKVVYDTFCKGRQEFTGFDDTKNFASRLRSLRKTVATGDAAGSEKKKSKWRDSPAKDYLEKQILDGMVPEKMAAEEVYQKFCCNRPEFEVFGDNNFSSRLKSLRAAIAKKKNHAERDAKALAQSRTIYPRPHQDGFGLPYWPDCDAKELLEEDIEENKHTSMSKEKLWRSRPEHYEFFPLKVFVGHIHQEVKTQKFHAYLQDKAEKKIQNKFLKNIPSNTKK